MTDGSDRDCFFFLYDSGDITSHRVYPESVEQRISVSHTREGFTGLVDINLPVEWERSLEVESS